LQKSGAKPDNVPIGKKVQEKGLHGIEGVGSPHLEQEYGGLVVHGNNFPR
jgi:hypothetical protein